MIERITRSPALLALSFVLSALLGAGIFAAAQAVVPGGAAGADRARIEAVVRDYLLEHPEILPEAIEKLRARELADNAKAATAAVAANRAAIEKPFAGAWAGNPNGDVTVVAFLDYACGYCRASLPAIAELLKRDPKVRLVYREFPVLGEDSVTAARWALAAAEQGRFQPFHEALYAEQRPTEEAIAAAAAKAGLDQARARSVAASKQVEDEVAANHRLGAELRLTGTPAWVVGDQVLSGVLSADELARAVGAARRGS